MEKVYNLIRLPIFEQGYRYFSDAPPDIGVFLLMQFHLRLKLMVESILEHLV